MAEQFSLFGAEVVGPPAASRRSAPFNPSSLPVPAKRGAKNRRFGTSSWTYPGWQGSVYRSVEDYGSSQRFGELCLGEYARDPRFRCAGADTFYYLPPAARRKLLVRYREQLDAITDSVDLLPKVWHAITVHRYSPLQQREWRLDAELNPHYLDPDRFVDQVALPLHETLGPHLGPLILELQESDQSVAEFLGRLEPFLGAVRARFSGRIAVELRSQAHLVPRYLDLLHAHGCSHVMNAWTRMPAIGWQYDELRARHGHGWPFLVLRALLRPGVRYDDASAYAPYDRIVTRVPEVRADILRVLREADAAVDCYVLVNNHLEGHSPGTIAELQDLLFGPAG